MSVRILHILDHSLPEQSGYASRSHSILTATRQLNLKVEAVTSPKQGDCPRVYDEIDGIRYYRSNAGRHTKTHGIFGQLRTISGTRRTLRSQLLALKPDVIHAHSPCLNGIAAIKVGVPMLYEMRSSWEDAAVSSGITREGSIRYRASRCLENAVVRRAGAIVVICEGLRRELISRGISEHKIQVVPNALPDPMFIRPASEDVVSLKKKYRLEGFKVIGFFGSFFEWEGVDLLIKALPGILQSVPNARLLIAGGGRQDKYLRRLVADFGLSENVIFVGMLPMEQMNRHYALADVFVCPRRKSRLTEMVTPLKPLEAMAQGVPVVASSVGGHRELIRDQETGFLHCAEDISSLVRTIVSVMQNESASRSVARRAAAWVTSERSWRSVARLYMPVYESLRSQRSADFSG